MVDGSCCEARPGSVFDVRQVDHRQGSGYRVCWSWQDARAVCNLHGLELVVRERRGSWRLGEATARCLAWQLYQLLRTCSDTVRSVGAVSSWGPEPVQGSELQMGVWGAKSGDALVGPAAALPPGLI